jgi:hypothetical protein
VARGSEFEPQGPQNEKRLVTVKIKYAGGRRTFDIGDWALAAMVEIDH